METRSKPKKGEQVNAEIGSNAIGDSDVNSSSSFKSMDKSSSSSWNADSDSSGTSSSDSENFKNTASGGRRSGVIDPFYCIYLRDFYALQISEDASAT